MKNIWQLLVVSMFCTIALNGTAWSESISLNIKDSTGSDRYVVTDSGKVGIGSSTPLSAIHVLGNTANNSQLILHLNGAASEGGGGVLAYHTNANGTLPFVNDRLGYYLFGTQNAGTYLNTAGISAHAEPNWTWSPVNTPTYLSFQTTFDSQKLERMRITGSGNVAIGLADPLTYKLYVAGSVHVTTLLMGSDKKLKKNITEIDSPLEKVMQLKGHKYEFNREDFTDKNLPEGIHYGVIAQEIEQVLPEMVRVDEDGTKSVEYIAMIPVLIEAIKAQQKQIDELKARIR